MKIFAELFPSEVKNPKSGEQGIPTACREGYLNKDNRKTYNEQLNWLKNLTDNGPIWSRSRLYNCMGQQRSLPLAKWKQYDIEISKRLFSLWGNGEVKEDTLLVSKSKKQGIICNILACCACLKYNLHEWFGQVLDEISKNAVKIYPVLLRKLNITDNEFQVQHLKREVFHLDGINFSVQLHKVATGSLYMPYGLHEFNLARALMWFFKNYQFGLIACSKQCLAFGFAVDTDHGFFMFDSYDEVKQFSPHILRTNHLQILLYCLILSLNVPKENEKFTIYALDIQMEDVKKVMPIKRLSFNFNEAPSRREMKESPTPTSSTGRGTFQMGKCNVGSSNSQKSKINARKMFGTAKKSYPLSSQGKLKK